MFIFTIHIFDLCDYPLSLRAVVSPVWMAHASTKCLETFFYLSHCMSSCCIGSTHNFSGHSLTRGRRENWMHELVWSATMRSWLQDVVSHTILTIVFFYGDNCSRCDEQRVSHILCKWCHCEYLLPNGAFPWRCQTYGAFNNLSPERYSDFVLAPSCVCVRLWSVALQDIH